MDFFSGLKRLVFPISCPLCGGELHSTEGSFCSICRAELPYTGLHMRQYNHITRMFEGRVPLVTASALMYFRHDTTAQAAIHQFKYLSNTRLAFTLGQTYGRLLTQSRLYDPVEVLLPVPLHTSRLLKRGYNQAEIFCRGMACQMSVRVETKALCRTKATQTQTRHHSKQERWDNVHGAFRLVNPAALSGRGVMIVDDVITTGSTIESCAEAVLSVLPEQRLWIGSTAVVKK